MLGILFGDDPFSSVITARLYFMAVAIRKASAEDFILAKLISPEYSVTTFVTLAWIASSTSIYSPDFNPIEKFWANLKRWLRDFLCFYDSLHAALYDRLVLFLS